MKLTVLCDNNTYIDEYYFGEPGVCYLIEDEGKKLLLDTGYCDVYLKNAQKMGIDLKEVDAVVFSHGHDDHTGGIAYFPKCGKRMELYGHSDVLEPKRGDGMSIGCPLSEEELSKQFDLKLSKNPQKVSPNITFLGEIPRTNEFENQKPVGEHLEDGIWKGDFLKDDSALVYEKENGIYIISGCSHSGICNICEYAKKVTGKNKILGLIGGFHLFPGDKEQTEKTALYLKNENIPELYPCHCTCFRAKACIDSEIKIKEVGVSLVLNW